MAHPINKVVLNIHLFAQLAPNLLQRQLIISVNESIKSYNVKVLP